MSPTSSRGALDFAYILGTILLTVYGQLVTKWQVSLLGPLPDDLASRLRFIQRLLANPWVLSSLTAAFLAFLCWAAALSKFELSYAYPFMSLSFVLVLGFGWLLFREPMTIHKAVGVALIMAGLAIGSRTP